MDYKVLDPTYTRTSAILRQGVDVTLQVLEKKNFTSFELVTGRMINERFKLGQKNFKKAGSCAEKYVDRHGHPKLSGWDQTKVLSKILDDMWELLKSPNNKETDHSTDPLASSKSGTPDQTLPDDMYKCSCGLDKAACGVCGNGWGRRQANGEIPPFPRTMESDFLSDDNGDEDVSDVPPVSNRVPSGAPNQRPDDWFFPGFMAFASYYPFAENLSAGRNLDFIVISIRIHPTQIIISVALEEA